MIEGTIAVLNLGCVDVGLTRWLAAQPSTVEIDLIETAPDAPRGEIARKRNVAIDRMRGDFILYVDADCIPPAHALDTFCSRALPLLGGVCLERSSTFDVCATRTFEPTIRYQLDELPATGLLPVLALGAGCLFIHRQAFEKLTPPWFRCGQLVVDCLTEDADFCLRAMEAGITPYLDCSVRVGHRVGGVCWPSDSGVRMQWEESAHRELLVRSFPTPTPEPAVVTAGAL